MLEEIREQHDLTDSKPSPPLPPQKQGLIISRKRQLVFLALMIFLAAKGLVGIEDIAFVILCTIYLFVVMARFAFPRKQTEQKKRLAPKSKLFRAYFLGTAIIGLLFPICYVGDGIYRGDIHGVGAVAPHLFLLSGQVFTEPIGFSDKFSTPVASLVPVFYNTRRLYPLLDWVKAEFSDTQRPGGSVRVYGGRAIASVNTVMWFYNLFGFLLPVLLPRSFEIYFSDDNKDN